MVRNWQPRLGQLTSIAIALGITNNTPPSKLLAQITPDATLGTESSVVNSDVIKGIPSDRISGGAIRGSNLFHSFQEFNIKEGRGAYFANPEAIENIFSRVTGSNPSNLLGTLGVLGNANLFFLNPNGIIFGPNARLDVKGSFVGSTASSIVFPNGTQFGATNPEAPPLLTVNVQQPIGLQFEGQEGLITSAADLAVGQNLTLAGSNLDLQGQLQAGRDITLQATDTVKVRDSLEQPFIASASGKLLLQGNQGIDIFALNHSDSGFFSGGDMVLRSANTVGGDAHFWANGSFRLEQLDGSLGNWLSFYDPIIRARGDVKFNSYQGASLHILAGGSVEIPGTITITQPDTTANSIQEQVTLSDDVTVLNIDGNGQPTLDIRAGIDFGTQGVIGNTEGFSPVPELGDTRTSAKIAIDSIVNEGGVVFLTNQYQPNSNLSGEITVGFIDTTAAWGGGSVFIDARDGIKINGTVNVSGVASEVISGDGGNVNLLANGDITLTPGNIFSQGLLGGNITLKSQGDIFITATAATDEIASTSFTSEPDTTGGDIKILARSLFLSNGAQLNAVTSGEAQAGSVIIQASETVSFDGVSSNEYRFPSGAFSTVKGTGGNGGNVIIETKRLKLTNEAQAGTATFTSGDTGNLVIRAQSVEVRKSLLSAAVQKGATGNGGKLTIETEHLLATDGGQVTTATLESAVGDAGDLEVRATEIELIGTDAKGFPSGLFAQVETKATGNSGELTVEAEHLLVADGAQISVSMSGSGKAGELTVRTKEMELIGNNGEGLSSGLFASASGGSGIPGNINVQTHSLLLDNQGTITAESSAGNQGNIFLQSQNILLRRGSAITTNALGDATGGNIIIDTDFIIAFPLENNDITANAFTGDGGRVEITAQGIFGIEPRVQLTPLSDITASSTFGLAGIVEINTPDLDPNRGLNNLPEEAVEVEIASGCRAEDGQTTVGFFNLGRGGLPPSPHDPLRSETIITPWIPLVSEAEKIKEQALSEESPVERSGKLLRTSCNKN